MDVFGLIIPFWVFLLIIILAAIIAWYLLKFAIWILLLIALVFLILIGLEFVIGLFSHLGL